LYLSQLLLLYETHSGEENYWVNTCLTVT
jgi:hypothetical protein